MSDVLSAAQVQAMTRYAADSMEWREPIVKSADEFLQRIWNLADDVAALARTCEQLRVERDAAADRLSVVLQEVGEIHGPDTDRQLIRELRWANQSLVARITELEQELAGARRELEAARAMVADHARLQDGRR